MKSETLQESEVSMEALREAIINAFCHRDWRDPDYVQVAIFKDRVEIRNPGTLYGNLTIEDLHRGNVSQRRNPLIADLFRRIEMVESWGRGMTLIHENAPAVAFREVGQLFIASFARPSFSANDAETADNAVERQESTKETPKKHQENTKEQILTALRATPTLSVAALAGVLNKTPNGIRHHLRTLQADGRIRHVGPTKAGRWEVLNAAPDTVGLP